MGCGWPQSLSLTTGRVLRPQATKPLGHLHRAQRSDGEAQDGVWSRGGCPYPTCCPVHSLWVLPSQVLTPGARWCSPHKPSPITLSQAQWGHRRLIRESSCCRCSWTPKGIVGVHILQRDMGHKGQVRGESVTWSPQHSCSQISPLISLALWGLPSWQNQIGGMGTAEAQEPQSPFL